MAIMDTIMQSAGGRWFKFTNPGDGITGKIVAYEERQAREYMTDKPKTWTDGSPALEVLFTLATDQHDDADDDGKRTISIKGWGIQREALRDACQKAGRPPIVGDMMRAVYVGDEKGSGFTAKRYEYSLKLQPEVAEDPAQGRGIVPPYVEQPAKASVWPDDDTPF
jgi:hypothetical protein